MRAAMVTMVAALLAAAVSADPVPPLARSLPELKALLAPLPGPIARITLVGDPEKPGLYVQILRFDPHRRLDPHHHSADRISTVLGGSWSIGYGPRFDAVALKPISTGSTFTEPAGINHFGEAGDEPAYVEVSGIGPVTTTPAGASR